MDELQNKAVEALSNAAKDLFTTMIDLPLSIGAAHQDSSKVEKAVTAMIGCAGGYRGVVNIFFPEKAAFSAVEAMTGMSVESFDACTKDAVGEIANMIIGGAKNELYEKDVKFNISTPTVIVGSSYSLYSGASQSQTIIPMSVSGNAFYVAFYLKKVD